MGQKTTEVLSQILTLAIDEDAKAIPLFVAERACRVTNIAFTTEAAVNKANTNYNVYVVGKGTASTIGTIQNGPNSASGTSFTAKTAQALTVVTTARVNELAAGDVLWLSSTKEGNGLAMGRTLVEVTIAFPSNAAS